MATLDSVYQVRLLKYRVGRVNFLLDRWGDILLYYERFWDLQIRREAWARFSVGMFQNNVEMWEFRRLREREKEEATKKVFARFMNKYNREGIWIEFLRKQNMTDIPTIRVLKRQAEKEHFLLDKWCTILRYHKKLWDKKTYQGELDRIGYHPLHLLQSPIYVFSMSECLSSNRDIWIKFRYSHYKTAATTLFKRFRDKYDPENLLERFFGQNETIWSNDYSIVWIITKSKLLELSEY